MNPQHSSTPGMIDMSLYATNNVVDRMVQGGGRVLRSNGKKSGNHTVAPNHKNEDKIVDIVMCKLKEEMDRLTDPILLYLAREDQQSQ